MKLKDFGGNPFNGFSVTNSDWNRANIKDFKIESPSSHWMRISTRIEEIEVRTSFFEDEILDYFQKQGRYAT